MHSFLLTRLLPLLALLLVAGRVALAQPGSTGPAPVSSSPTAIPLDGGASLLLAGGVAYGLKRLRKRRQKA